jgi:competence protein ComEC
MLVNRPAVKFCLPFLLGIIVGWEFFFSIWYISAFLIFLFITSVISVLFYKEKDVTLQILIVALLFTLGIFKITLDGKYSPQNQIDNFITHDGVTAIRGIITDPPRKKTKTIQFVIESESLEVKKSFISTTGGVLVTIPKDSTSNEFLYNLEYGTKVLISGQPVQPGTARNPGEFDLRRYLHINGIYARIFLENTTEISIEGEKGSWFLASVVYPLRKSISIRLDQFIGGEESKFLKGILIGDRSEIPYEVKDAFVNSGVMHILAVSGLHVGMIILIVFALLTTFRLPEQVRIIVTCSILIFYVFLTGQSPSVVRATVMGIIVLCSMLVERKIDVYNSLALAAIVLLFFDAKQLFQPGFQLSFTAVISIVSLYPKIFSIQNILPEKTRGNNAVKFVIGLVAVSISAAIGTLPFTSYYFGKISIIGLVANLLIVPLTGIVLFLGITTTGFSFISEWFASMYAETTKLTAGILLQSVSIFGNWKYSFIYSNFTLWSGFLFYFIVAFVFTLQRTTIRKRIIIFVLIGANIFLFNSIFLKDAPKLKVTFLDVGQGDAIFLEFPDGKNMLVDSGPKTFFRDAGERFIAPFLRREGIEKLDFIVNSHPDHDHLGGIPFLMRNFRIGEITDAGLLDSTKIFHDYRNLIDSLRLSYKIVKRGELFGGFNDGRIYILNPGTSYDSVSPSNLNDQSVVMKIVYDKTSLLLTGDAQSESENMMISRYKNYLHSDIIKCAHHGSMTSSGEEFLKYVNPSVALISVGYKNQFKHPSPEVIRRLRQRGIQIHRTDQEGAVIFESDGKSWKKIDWR